MYDGSARGLFDLKQSSVRSSAVRRTATSSVPGLQKSRLANIHIRSYKDGETAVSPIAAMNEKAVRSDGLATFRKFMARLSESWPAFLRQRRSRLVQQERNGVAAEKVAENIVEDLFTIALDWSVGDLNNQLQYADIVLTKQGIKRLLVEVKRPGSLRWDQPSLHAALAQARRYADEQRVRSIAVSDGTLFYAADISYGGLQPRARLLLDAPTYSPDAWWLSVDGIYRPAKVLGTAEDAPADPSPSTPGDSTSSMADGVFLHPKYKLPAECFAYVGDASKPLTELAEVYAERSTYGAINQGFQVKKPRTSPDAFKNNEPESGSDSSC